MVNYSVTQYGEARFGLNYNDEELTCVIDSFIQNKKNNKDDYFTYFTLCKFVLETADIAGKLNGKEANTYYQQPNLSQKEYTRISRLIWDFILGRKVFVDFSNNAYIAHYDNDTVFGIMDD